STLTYSTYLGGTGGDSVAAIAVDGAGDAYVTGNTSSTDFPTTAGAFQTTAPGVSDAFVTKLNPTGTAAVYSTYLGGSVTLPGSGADSGRGIAIDGGGFAYVVGSTNSFNFPTTAGAFQTALVEPGLFNDAFVTKLNAAGSAPVYSTYLGGAAADDGFSI